MRYSPTPCAAAAPLARPLPSPREPRPPPGFRRAQPHRLPAPNTPRPARSAPFGSGAPCHRSLSPQQSRQASCLGSLKRCLDLSDTLFEVVHVFAGSYLLDLGIPLAGFLKEHLVAQLQRL